MHFEKAAELRREVMLFEAMVGNIWIQVGVGNVNFLFKKMFVSKRWLHHDPFGSKICRFCSVSMFFFKKTLVHQAISEFAHKLTQLGPQEQAVEYLELHSEASATQVGPSMLDANRNHWELQLMS